LDGIYYLENQLRFPFRAKCTMAKVVSPLRKGETGKRSRSCAWHQKMLARPTFVLDYDPIPGAVAGGHGRGSGAITVRLEPRVKITPEVQEIFTITNDMDDFRGSTK